MNRQMTKLQDYNIQKIDTSVKKEEEEKISVKRLHCKFLQSAGIARNIKHDFQCNHCLFKDFANKG